MIHTKRLHRMLLITFSPLQKWLLKMKIVILEGAVQTIHKSYYQPHMLIDALMGAIAVGIVS